VDVHAAQERGQLTVVDADEILPRFMRDAMPDPPVFRRVFEDVLGGERTGGSYQKVRAWGEMVNVLWERGDIAASMNLEDLGDYSFIAFSDFSAPKLWWSGMVKSSPQFHRQR
jgi:hypothetical protein